MAPVRDQTCLISWEDAYDEETLVAADWFRWQLSDSGDMLNNYHSALYMRIKKIKQGMPYYNMGKGEWVTNQAYLQPC